MPPDPRRIRSLCCASLLLTASAWAQPTRPPDTLEQPYGPVETPLPSPPVQPESSAPPPTEPAPPARASAPVTGAAAPAPVPIVLVVGDAPASVDTRPRGPIRARRRIALAGEVGWNGLAGFGPTLSFHATPNISFDLGAGLSLTGWKLGLRGRYNLLRGPVTPFIGAGFIGSSGFGEVSGDASSEDDPKSPPKDPFTIRVGPSAFLQTVGGIDWTTQSGFTLLGTLGWAFVLNDNVKLIAGTPSSDEKLAFDVLFRSGPVITLGTGYSFQ